MGGKFGGRGTSKTQLPTSAARRRFLKRRERAARKRNTSRVSSRAGRQLEDKWVPEFLRARYKYVFVQVRVKGNVKRPRFGLPGQVDTGPPFRLSSRAPVADIVFGDDLDDLKWFDSKRDLTTSFQDAQRVVYPPLNENGGRIALKPGDGPLINLVDGQPVDILDGKPIKPGRGHVGFQADLSAVASRQRDLRTLLDERAGNLHPPSSELQLEDSRMITERRARYRPSRGTEPSATTDSKARATADDAVEGEPSKPKRPATLPATPPDADLAKTKLRPKVKIPKGLIFSIVLDIAIGAIISSFEEEIDALVQERIKANYAERVLVHVQEMLDAFLWLEKNSPDKLERSNQYSIQVVWEVLLREQAEDISDVAVWFFKFSTMNPGFIELYEDVNYISHRSVPFTEKKLKPRRRRDPNDDTLIRYRHTNYILVWDGMAHEFAVAFRQVAHKGLVQLDVLHAAVVKIRDTLPPKARKNIEKFLIGQGMQAIADALYKNDFREAKKQSRLIVHSIRGQLAVAKVPEYRTERVVKEADKIRSELFESSELFRVAREMDSDRKNLLSMFLNIEFEKLR